MEYHYALGENRHGPVSEEEFRRLIALGTITASTLVWHAGMANWQPSSAVVGPTTAAAPVVLSGGVRCSQCGQTFEQADVINLGSGPCCAACKPQVLQRMKEGLSFANNAEDIRQKHIKHEASIKSIGFLYFLGGALWSVVGVFGAFALFAGSSSAEDALTTGMLFSVMTILGVGCISLGVGLRRLRPWARVPTGILACIGLLGFPVGTLINGYILYMVFSEKGKTVLSEEYRAVIEQTPHIKYKTSIVVWICLGILLLLILAGVMAAIFG